jgi:hypothetical protein
MKIAALKKQGMFLEQISSFISSGQIRIFIQIQIAESVNAI